MTREVDIVASFSPAGRNGRRRVPGLLPALALLAILPWRRGRATAERPPAGGAVVLVGGWILDRRDIAALSAASGPGHAG